MLLRMAHNIKLTNSLFLDFLFNILSHSFPQITETEESKTGGGSVLGLIASTSSLATYFVPLLAGCSEQDSGR